MQISMLSQDVSNDTILNYQLFSQLRGILYCVSMNIEVGFNVITKYCPLIIYFLDFMKIPKNVAV